MPQELHAPHVLDCTGEELDAVISNTHTHDNKADLDAIGTAALRDVGSETGNVVLHEDMTTALADVDDTLGTKVDKVDGKGLSTEDYTTAEKVKLAGIEAEANKYIHPDTHAASMITGLGTAAAKDTGTSAGNVVTVGSGGKIDESVIPAVAITDTHEVASEAAMLALDAQKGDVAVRSDVSKTYILQQAPATVLAKWIELRTPTDAVLSVAGKTGAVSLEADDISLTGGGTVQSRITQINGSLNAFGSAVAYDVGTSEGNVPVVGANGKLPAAIMPPSVTVEDVLTSESTSNALSAAQGKVLDAKISAITNPLSHLAEVSAPNGNWVSMCESVRGDEVVAVGDNISMIRDALQSVWTLDTDTPTGVWKSVCATYYSYIAVGSNRIMQREMSTYQSAWAAIASPPPGEWRSVCYDEENNRVIAVGNACIAYSPDDGGTWTTVGTPEELNVVVASAGVVIAAGVNSLLRSVDGGTTWTTLTLSPSSGVPSSVTFTFISYENGLFYAYAGGYMTYVDETSTDAGVSSISNPYLLTYKSTARAKGVVATLGATENGQALIVANNLGVYQRVVPSTVNGVICANSSIILYGTNYSAEIDLTHVQAPVIDDLYTNDPTCPLSSRQGTVLHDMIEALTARVTALENA